MSRTCCADRSAFWVFVRRDVDPSVRSNARPLAPLARRARVVRRVLFRALPPNPPPETPPLSHHGRGPSLRDSSRADGDPSPRPGLPPDREKVQPEGRRPREARDERGVLQGPVPRARRPRLESPAAHDRGDGDRAAAPARGAGHLGEGPERSVRARACLNAAAFVVDVATHAFLAGGDASAVDGNILQKGHSYSQLVFVALMAAGNCLVVGEKNPWAQQRARHRLEDDGRAVLHQRQGPRADQHLADRAWTRRSGSSEERSRKGVVRTENENGERF